MTPLTIITNYEKKRLKCYGTVAAGEHVLVTVTGGTEWVAPDGENQTLRLRLLFGPHTVGVFPFVTEDMHEDDPETFPTVDEWDVDGDDPTCDLNLNTIQAAKYLKFGGNCLFVLDDPTNDILYATGEFEVLPWPKRRGADLPYDLDGYPDFVFDAKNAMAEAAETAQDAANAASAAEATATRLEQDVYGHRQAAESAATNAQNSASSASNSATEAKGWANGGTDGDTPTATNNAKYYAGQAGDAKTDAAASAASASASATAAEAWATGGTGGTPSATNNAKYYAEQAEETLEDKADKVASATNGNFAGLDANGNLTDSGNKATDFAPATDIAKTALASDVQTSLGKADSAVQPSDILSDDKIKTALLPSFVDDVLEFSALANFPATGETGKIYVAKDTNKTYRWSGSSYVEISASLALGETSSTAYRGDKGKTAYDHATDSNRLTTAKASGLYKIATTAEGHVKSVTAVEKSDITALGIPAQDTTYTLPPATASTLGGVKQGTGCEITEDGTLNVTGGGGGTVDDTVTRTSANPVKSSGIWAAIWGTLTALPTGFTALYDYCMGWFADAKSLAPVWDFGILYHVGDFCVESRMGGASGRLYRCKKEYTTDSGDFNGPSLDTEHWEPVDVTTLIANKQDALSAAQLANIAAVPGKADSADLRYRIAEAQVAEWSVPDSWLDITYTSNGYANTITSLDSIGIDVVGDYIDLVDEPGGLTRFARFDNSTGLFVGVGSDVSDLTFDGVAPTATTALAPASYALADRAVNLITATDETSIDIELPAAVTVDGVRYARDFLLDVDNSANANDLALEFTGLDVDYAFVPLEDDSISEMMTIGAGERVRLYFTETPYHATGSLPVINVASVTLGDFVTSTTPATQGGN